MSWACSAESLALRNLRLNGMIYLINQTARTKRTDFTINVSGLREGLNTVWSDPAVCI
jgi:hypothetical protein